MSKKIVLDLNDDCMKLFPKVEEVYTFDDDHLSLILHEIFDVQIERIVGLKTIRKQCMQVSFYKMPNGKVCACAYPSSVKVNYDKFNEDVRKVFKHVDRTNFSGQPYGFYLYLKRNGYKSKI